MDQQYLIPIIFYISGGMNSANIYIIPIQCQDKAQKVNLNNISRNSKIEIESAAQDDDTTINLLYMRVELSSVILKTKFNKSPSVIHFLI